MKEKHLLLNTSQDYLCYFNICFWTENFSSNSDKDLIPLSRICIY